MNRRIAKAVIVLIALLVVVPALADHLDPEIVATLDLEARAGLPVVDTLTGRLYLASGTAEIVVVDGRLAVILDRIDIGDRWTQAINGVAVSPLHSRLFVAVGSREKPAVVVVDTVSGRVERKIGKIGIPKRIAVNLHTGRVYVTTNDTGSPSVRLVVIDGASRSPHVVGTVPVPGRPGAAKLAVNPLTERAYVASWTGLGVDAVSVIDGTDGKLVATIPIPAAGDHDLAVDPALDRVYVTGRDLTVIDGVTNTVVDEIEIDAEIERPAINPNNHKVYVPTRRGHPSNALVVVDGGSGAIVNTLLFGSTPPNPAVNARTNRVWLGVDGSIRILDGDTEEVVGVLPLPWPSTSPILDPDADLGHVLRHLSFDALSVIAGHHPF